MVMSDNFIDYYNINIISALPTTLRVSHFGITNSYIYGIFNIKKNVLFAQLRTSRWKNETTYRVTILFNVPVFHGGVCHWYIQ